MYLLAGSTILVRCWNKPWFLVEQELKKMTSQPTELLLETAELRRKLLVVREETKYCDVTILAHHHTFHAHKCILAAGSTFFNLLLNRSEDLEEPLSSVCLLHVQPKDVQCMDSVLDFMYCGRLTINYDNFLSILRLAEYLVMEDLLRLIKDYIKEHLNADNCLKLYLDLRCLCNSIDKGCMEGQIVQEMRQDAWEMVETKFYDHIIMKEGILQVCK